MRLYTEEVYTLFRFNGYVSSIITYSTSACVSEPHCALILQETNNLVSLFYLISPVISKLIQTLPFIVL